MNRVEYDGDVIMMIIVVMRIMIMMMVVIMRMMITVIITIMMIMVIKIMIIIYSRNYKDSRQQ